jgi:hypothetical protein
MFGINRRSVAALTGVASLLALGVGTAAPASAASAGPTCRTAYQQGVNASAGHSYVGLPTSLMSSWVTGPGTITRTLTTTSTVTVTLSGSTTFGIDALIAEAKTTFGVSVATSVARAASWSYSLSVPAGKTEFVQQYHEALQFQVGDYCLAGYDTTVNNPCVWTWYSCVTLWKNLETMRAPVSSTADVTYLYRLSAVRPAAVITWP